MARQISQLRAIDTSRCPQDFRIAVEQFVSAYDDYRTCFAAKPEGLAFLVTDTLSYANTLKEKAYKYGSTIENINLLAAKYGAKERIVTDQEPEKKESIKTETKKAESDIEKIRKDALEQLRNNK